ncbi:hypothetical protein ABOM_002752, partial [Aspergillus bombycis]
MFGLGGMTCVAGILRLVTLIQLTHSDDISEHNGPTTGWSSIEMNTAL